MRIGKKTNAAADASALSDKTLMTPIGNNQLGDNFDRSDKALHPPTNAAG